MEKEYQVPCQEHSALHNPKGESRSYVRTVRLDALFIPATARRIPEFTKPRLWNAFFPHLHSRPAQKLPALPRCSGLPHQACPTPRLCSRALSAHTKQSTSFSGWVSVKRHKLLQHRLRGSLPRRSSHIQAAAKTQTLSHSSPRESRHLSTPTGWGPPGESTCLSELPQQQG